jgi:hypothetical protein
MSITLSEISQSGFLAIFFAIYPTGIIYIEAL